MEISGNRRNLLLLLLAVVVFAIVEQAGLVNMRAIYVDEAWYANPAYNLLHGHGLKNTVVGSGGNANFVLPLLISLSMKLWGESLFAIRFASVFCGLLSLPVLHLIMNEFKCRIPSRLVGYALFVSLSVFNLAFRTGRPESVSILFCLLGVYWYIRYCRTWDWRDMLCLSLMALVSFFCHPFTLLMYACMGAVSLLEALHKRKKTEVCHLAMLLAAALCCFVALYFLDSGINISSDDAFKEGMAERLFATSGIFSTLAQYMKQMFVSKQVLFSIPFVVMCIFVLCRSEDYRIKTLSIVCLAFVLLFPLVFPFSAMLSASATYLATMGVCIAIGMAREFIEGNNDCRRARIYFILCSVYCLINFVVINGYNITKYDSSNTTLAKEFGLLVPEGSLVYGSLDMWPFMMNTQFYSTHYRLGLPADGFEFIVTSEKQERECGWPSYQEQLNRAERDYKLVYQTDTKHYGRVRLFRRKP